MTPRRCRRPCPLPALDPNPGRPCSTCRVQTQRAVTPRLACADRPVESASKIRSNSVMRSAPPVVSHADAGLPGQRDRFRGFATVSCDGRRSNEIQRSLHTERLISVAMATAPPRLMRHIEVLGDSLPRAERYAEPGREVPE
ncbi:MAG: hypothetical protein QOG97_3741 [Acidimicrobiaceae bacterium]|jgi:hypothetical protein|nr:hypothetical protein [Acidimicrobiaceae bacterium]